MKHISELTRKDIKDIKLIVFDVDGVLVHRGTKIKQEGDVTTLETKKISDFEIKHLRELNRRGFFININSGRGLYMLQNMFREVLDFVSLTYENGSATWFKGKIYQHANSFEKLKKIYPKLAAVRHKDIIKGFEPKEFIISIHCEKRVKEIEEVMKNEKDLYYIWNSEAYDIGVRNLQTKNKGLRKLKSLLKLKKKNVMAIGDNYNDRELLDEAGLAVSADKSRLDGDFYVDLDDKILPAGRLMERMLEILN